MRHPANCKCGVVCIPPPAEEVAFQEQMRAGDRNAALVYADWLDEHTDRHEEAAALRAGKSPRLASVNVPGDFYTHVIAQDDDDDYSESGYVAAIIDGKAYLASYSHCSCYGTWSSIRDGELTNWDWHGTPDELVEMARTRADPGFPSLTINDSTYDADHLLEVYRQILEWDANDRRVVKSPAV